jgi:hypothetical protein
VLCRPDRHSHSTYKVFSPFVLSERFHDTWCLAHCQPWDRGCTGLCDSLWRCEYSTGWAKVKKSENTWVTYVKDYGLLFWRYVWWNLKQASWQLLSVTCIGSVVLELHDNGLVAWTVERNKRRRTVCCYTCRAEKFYTRIWYWSELEIHLAWFSYRALFYCVYLTNTMHWLSLLYLIRRLQVISLQNGAYLFYIILMAFMYCVMVVGMRNLFSP